MFRIVIFPFKVKVEILLRFKIFQTLIRILAVIICVILK